MSAQKAIISASYFSLIHERRTDVSKPPEYANTIFICSDLTDPSPGIKDYFPRFLWHPLLPIAGISSRVNHADNFHCLCLKDIKDFEWECADQRTPDISAYLGTTHGIFFDLSKNCSNFSEEFVTQSWFALFVPVELPGHISFRFRPNDEPVAHFLREVTRA
jgi:hypothetical protein